MGEYFDIIHSVKDFTDWWRNESDGTRRIMSALNDQSLEQEVAAGHRNLARLAWHIVGSISEMGGRVGLKIDSPTEQDPIPSSSEEIKAAYDRAANSLLNEVQSNWSDETLKQTDDMYGMTWTRSLTLAILVHHEIHHRGQMTVLLRQAGLKVPGVYGPSYEEWTNYDAEPPAV
jgi:uncharacterized damage-inducible protein DinB